MGVYIENMEMPKSCSSCKIKRRNGEKMVCPLCDEELDIRDPMSSDHRLADCPLVPVPPHGRWNNIIQGIIPSGQCSNCGAWDKVTRFCPNCGFRMEDE